MKINIQIVLAVVVILLTEFADNQKKTEYSRIRLGSSPNFKRRIKGLKRLDQNLRFYQPLILGINQHHYSGLILHSCRCSKYLIDAIKISKDIGSLRFICFANYIPALWNQSRCTQSIKQTKKRFLCVLIIQKTKFSTFGHARHHFYRPAQIQIRVPG